MGHYHMDTMMTNCIDDYEITIDPDIRLGS